MRGGARLTTLMFLVLLLAIISGLSMLLVRPRPLVIQGEVDCRKVNVAAKVPGRVEELHVREGDRVTKGQLLAVLDSPQLQAKLQQAAAARAAAAAQKQKADTGAREEQVRMALNQWLQARAGLELAEKSFARIQRLFEDGVVPAQKRDEVQAQRDMAARLEAAAKAQYDMAVNGTREEDKAAAAALVDQASGAVSEVESLLEEARVRAPVDGEVHEIIVNPGELASAGMPIVTLVDRSDLWVVFQAREDYLAGLKPGDRLVGSLPALSGRLVTMEVTWLAPMGDFAAWRATNIQGGFDLRTFEVRARPLEQVDALRAGMTVIVPWDRVSAPSFGKWLRDLMEGRG
ncbi:MAG TPA: efflux RND transporter periplasmic adaptor subunit [Candidatus Hydrogenedentes bacterium]|nr:efflux RND transporter periplasmic adaptor subunit [Candidatus Hydrogenedentota bacterium]HOK89660.1 efflux RND transporter periplasmic adaptor subunit [Candidatus Hydrogenedentota bacterium]